jgi:N-acylglucosamine-6-phosphate 2-epimerase
MTGSAHGASGRVAAALASLQGRLVVSCQALPGSPMRDPSVIASIAASVVAAGAGGVRIDSPEHIAQVKLTVATTVIGLWKVGQDGVYITPTLEHARAVVAAGADIVAIDGTTRPRPDGLTLRELIRALHDEVGAVVLADVGTAAEGVAAAESGADAVATTFASVGDNSDGTAAATLSVLSSLVPALPIPVIAEGGITAGDQAREALARGAWCVVVGKAISSPDWITARMLTALSGQPGEGRAASCST